MVLNLDERGRDDLLIGASLLIEHGCIDSLSELMYFFEKPHKFKEELKEIGQDVK